jgi:hypothetical protein
MPPAATTARSDTGHPNRESALEGGRDMARSLTLLAIGIFAWVLGMAPARTEVADLMQELVRLKAEQESTLQKKEESLALKRQNEAKLDALEQEKNRLKTEATAIDAVRPSVESLCNRTVPESQYQAALAQCNAVLRPFNDRVNRFNAALEQWKTNFAAVAESERARAAAARALLEQYNHNLQRMAEIRRIVLAAAPGQCVIERRCGELDGEAGADCLISCWDRGIGFRSTAAGAPEFSPAPARATGGDDISATAGAATIELKSIGIINPALSQDR